MSKKFTKIFVLIFIATTIVVAIIIFSRNKNNNSSFNISSENKNSLFNEIKKHTDYKVFEKKIIVVNFWAPWCGPCLEELPSLFDLLKAREKVFLVLIAVQSSSIEVSDFFIRLKIPKEISERILQINDGDLLSQKFDINKLPESYILDTNGEIKRKVIGSISWSSEEAISFFENLEKN